MVLRECEICKNKINLDMHPSGLVFDDHIFICQKCCDNKSEEEITEWSESKMRQPGCGMPIALWLIHEQNKDKQMMSRQKF